MLFSFVGSCLLLLANPDSTQQRVVVQNVTIVGNARTRERIIRRELALHAGDTLTRTKLTQQLELDRQKMVNTNLFTTVQLTARPLSDTAGGLGRVEIAVQLKEPLYLLALPILDVADRNFNEWWYDRGRDLKRVIFGVNALHQNLTGNADRLRIVAQLGFIPRLNMAYSLPYLDKKQRTGISIGIDYLTNRTMAYRTRADKLVFLNSETRNRERIVPSLTLTHRRSFYGFHSLNLAYSTTKISDTIARLNPNYFLNGRTRQNFTQLSYSYFYDRRDRAQYPLRGYFYSLVASRTGLLRTDDWRQVDFYLFGSKFFPISPKWFGSLYTEGRASVVDKQPFLQTRGLGYNNDLVRGYELYVIDGQHYGYARSNLRYQLLNRVFNLKFIKNKQFNTFPVAIYPNIYLDAGYVWNRFSELNNSQLANTLLIGGGAGLDFVFYYNFVARLNYSVNKMGEARPYFSIGREF
jgi:outer membrane protein assembly factor BamA